MSATVAAALKKIAVAILTNPKVLKTIPYDYWYTADVENDIHIDLDEMPESVADLIAVARGEQQNEEFDYVMKL